MDFDVLEFLAVPFWLLSYSQRCQGSASRLVANVASFPLGRHRVLVSPTLGRLTGHPNHHSPTPKKSLQIHPHRFSAHLSLIPCTMTADILADNLSGWWIWPQNNFLGSITSSRLFELVSMQRGKISYPLTIHIRATFRFLRELRQLQHRSIRAAQSLTETQLPSI